VPLLGQSRPAVLIVERCSSIHHVAVLVVFCCVAGACGGGSGTLPERFIITSPALYGGSCPRTNGSTRATVACTNSDPCPPVDCIGSFGNSGTCNGTCGGKQHKVLGGCEMGCWCCGCIRACCCVFGKKEMVAQCPGSCACPARQLTRCLDKLYVEITAEGQYASNTCTVLRCRHACIHNCASCQWCQMSLLCYFVAGGAGKQQQVFSISRAAAWGGQNCSEAAGAVRFLDCNNTGALR
jgi:hypothetical protein